MSDADDPNAKVIAEFRATGGRFGGPDYKGPPLTLIHHTGRKSGREYVTPVMYLPDDSDPDTIYVFASKSGAPEHPAWYRNLTAAGSGTVEVGTDSYRVTVAELKGAERDRVYAEQTKRFSGFADYETKTAGIRTIPVLALHRS
jgi:deazaflavin-dependent oxidoreductase (nitroreductase family)